MTRRAALVVLLAACRDPRELAPKPVPTEVVTPKPPPKPVAPGPPKLATDCTTDADCTMTSLLDDCCDHCGNLAVNRDSLSRLERHCESVSKKCPAIDCPFEPATAHCEKAKCVRRAKP